MDDLVERDFFISYNQADQAWAEWIAWTLEEAGYSTLLQAWHIRPGHDFMAQMRQAAAGCQQTLAVLSPSSLASEYAQKEWNTAVAADPGGKERKLIPVRVAECEPDAMLQTIVTIDFVGRDEEGARAALLEGLADSGKPAEKPLYPGVDRSPRGAPPPAGFPGPREPTPVRAWLDQVERDHRQLMPYFERRGAPLLEHVYVELRLAAPEAGEIEEVRRSKAAHEGRSGHGLAIRDVLDLDPQEFPWVTRRWLLRGDPGSGKTTLLRHLARTLAQAGGVPWVPVFESLPRWMREGWLFDRIEARLSKLGHAGAEVRRALEEQAEAGRLLLLLDGLDEVPTAHRGDAEALLLELSARWPEAPIVVTSRPIGLHLPGEDFREIEVLPFDAANRRAFLARWFGQSGEVDEAQALRVAAQLEGDVNLRELASNPLYLTLLALLTEKRRGLSGHRPELYDRIFALLEKGEHHDVANPIENPRLAHRSLCRLAYEMTEANLDAEALDALEERLWQDDTWSRQLKGTWESPRRFLTEVAEKTGILGDHDGPETDWRFWHRTFREALAAERLEGAYQAGGRAAIVAHARALAGDEGRWAEPYALLAGRIGDDADALVKALVAANPALGLRAVATAQGLNEGTLAEVLELTGGWRERARVYERIPELIDDPERALALVDQLRLGTRDGNDLFFLYQTAAAIGERWSDLAGRRAADLLERFFDHVSAPPEELFRWIDTPHDGRVELWREIPAGEGWVGSSEGESGYRDERPRHRVKILQPFRLAAAPVTNAQYTVFDPSHSWREWPGVSRDELAHHPVADLTWYAVMSFCRWLSGYFPGARLPFEEEWEVACRAGTDTRYWSGGGEGDLARVAWYDKNSEGRTHRVGEMPANPWGLYDVHGNVREWTASAWKSDYSAQAEGLEIDPAAPPADLAGGALAEDASARRVVRGGSSWSDPDWSRTAYRWDWDPGDELVVRGFRVLLPPAVAGPEWP